MSIKRSALNRQTAYSWYLGSAFWRERREYILKRADYTCEKCGKCPATEVHHLTYLRVFKEFRGGELRRSRAWARRREWPKGKNTAP